MQFLCRGPPTFTRWLRTWRCEKVLSPLVALPQPRVNSGPLTLWEGPESTCSPSMATSRLRTQHYEKVLSPFVTPNGQDPWCGSLMWEGPESICGPPTARSGVRGTPEVLRMVLNMQFKWHLLRSHCRL